MGCSSCNLGLYIGAPKFLSNTAPPCLADGNQRLREISSAAVSFQNHVRLCLPVWWSTKTCLDVKFRIPKLSHRMCVVHALSIKSNEIAYFAGKLRDEYEPN